MNPQQLIGIALIVAGALALAYGGFTYTRATHTADLGPIQLEMKERESVNVPIWAGIGLIVIGGVLVLIRR